jgi:Tol biopolymer transport system component
VSQRPARRRLASLASLVAFAALLTALPVVSLPGRQPQQVAEASVAAGDVVFIRQNTTSGYNDIVKRNASNGSVSTVVAGDSYMQDMVDVSPDGSRIAYVKSAASGCNGHCIFVSNSDGTGETQITVHSSGETKYDWRPRFSPDGQSIVYVRRNYDVSPPTADVYKVSASGGTSAAVTSHGEANEGATWSPDGSRIAYERRENGGYYSTTIQIHVIDADGTDDHRITSSTSSDREYWPAWAPSGNRLYWTAYDGTWRIAYADDDNSEESADDDDVTRGYLTTPTGGARDYRPRVSADGNTVYFSSTRASGGYEHIYSVTSGGASVTELTTGSQNDTTPAPVLAAWPPTPPSNSTVALEAPSPSDAPYTRQITIGLSATGADRFQYGWSTSSSTAPNTSYLQESTDLTDPKMGTLNFLGKYVSSAWNGGTQPDQDWYLWVRPANGGTPASWGTPLKVHTPRQPIWAVVGDSFSSGHHQDYDEYLCPDPEDSFNWLTSPACTFDGAPHVVPLDSEFSWVTEAVGSFNGDYDNGHGVPTAWRITLGPEDVLGIPAYFFALGGTASAAFGVPSGLFGDDGETIGSDEWASGTRQTAFMRAALYPRADSWNVVSVTGGADDTTWTQQMEEWYNDSAHFISTPPKPWMQESSTSNCPDSDAVYTGLTGNSGALGDEITANLDGVAEVAARHSPGVRVLIVGYPDVMDSSDSADAKSYCYSDHGSSPVWHGAHSTLLELNSNIAAITEANAQYVGVTSGFGSTPIHSGYIQPTRYYGYPHATSSGQSVIADAAVGVLTNQNLWS